MEECNRYLGSFFVSLPRHRNERGMATDFPCKRKLWHLATKVHALLNMRIHDILLEHMATEVFRLVVRFDFAHAYNESLSARSCTSGGGKI